VAIRHGHLLLNIAQMVAGFAITPRDVFVTWLPMYHDMGLVLMTLTPLVVGAALHVEESGLGAIRTWTATLARHRATFTAAPDFAYRLALRLQRPGAAAPDLSSLRVALDAAEPVRAVTVREFSAAYRLAPGVVLPGYGLAEATVGVTAPLPGSPLRVDERGAVALGRGFPGVRLRVAGERGEVLPAGQVGEVWVASPARAAGYFADPEASDVTFRADGWLRTGDLGYLDERGALFVVGRQKDLLSWGGSTVAPREIEELVDQLPFVRRSAAVGVELAGRTEGELPFLFVEVSTRGGIAHEELARQVVSLVRRYLGVGPARVCLVRPGTLPLTLNGKLRRAALAASYASGELAAQRRLLFPEA
jgi:fatty-acyl-CoA synthase